MDQHNRSIGYNEMIKNCLNETCASSMKSLAVERAEREIREK
jgi:hypothetical protein